MLTTDRETKNNTVITAIYVTVMLLIRVRVLAVIEPLQSHFTCSSPRIPLRLLGTSISAVSLNMNEQGAD